MGLYHHIRIPFAPVYARPSTRRGYRKVKKKVRVRVRVRARGRVRVSVREGEPRRGSATPRGLRE